MAVYNFKRDLKLYIVKNNLKYKLDIYPDISFSQTFDETEIKVKTLHSQYDMFESSVITKANPANFNFTVPITRGAEFKIILDLLLNYDSSSSEATVGKTDLYVEMNSEIYKLQNAVLESGVFRIVKNEIILLNCSGTASKLSKETSVPYSSAATSGVKSFAAPNALEISINSIIRDRINSVSIELKNEVNWVGYETLQKSLNVTNASDTMYPEAFVVESRTLSGSVQQYVTDETNSTVNTWASGVPLRIRTGNYSYDTLIDINLPQVIYTNRLNLGDLLLQSFDFKMISNPTDFSNIISIQQLDTSLRDFGLWAAI